MLEAHHLSSVIAYLERYGYGAVFGGVLMENFGLPLPGETLLIAGAILAAKGNMHIAWVMGLALFAAVAGDNLGYLIGRLGGRRLVLRYGRYVLVDEAKLHQLEGFFQRHGGKVVLGARFVQGLRQLNGIIAGISGMHWRRFLLYNLLGAVLWVGVWGSAGYFLGRHLDELAAYFHHLQRGALAALLLVAMALLAVALVLARRAKGRHAQDPTPDKRRSEPPP